MKQGRCPQARHAANVPKALLLVEMRCILEACAEAGCGISASPALKGDVPLPSNVTLRAEGVTALRCRER